MVWELLAVVAVVAVVAFVLSGPLRRPPAGAAGADGDRARIDELEAARDAKYREIRDAELDHRTGKLSREDWQALDAGLRAEAVEILRDLDRAAGRERPA